MGAAKSRTERELRYFTRDFGQVLDAELPSNRDLMARVIALGAEDRGGSLMPAPANVAYTSYLQALSLRSGPLETMAALLPCSWSYVTSQLRFEIEPMRTTPCTATGSATSRDRTSSTWLRRCVAISTRSSWRRPRARRAGTRSHGSSRRARGSNERSGRWPTDRLTRSGVPQCALLTNGRPKIVRRGALLARQPLNKFGSRHRCFPAWAAHLVDDVCTTASSLSWTRRAGPIRRSELLVRTPAQRSDSMRPGRATALSSSAVTGAIWLRRRVAIPRFPVVWDSGNLNPARR